MGSGPSRWTQPSCLSAGPTCHFGRTTRIDPFGLVGARRLVGREDQQAALIDVRRAAEQDHRPLHASEQPDETGVADGGFRQGVAAAVIAVAQFRRIGGQHGDGPQAQGGGGDHGQDDARREGRGAALHARQPSNRAKAS
jgi:hypothetical protein